MSSSARLRASGSAFLLYTCLAVNLLADAPPAELRFVHDTAGQRQVLFVPRSNEAAPRIDAVLDDPAWRSAFSTDKFLLPWGMPAPNRTELRVTWDDQNLYLAAVGAVNPEKGLRHGAEAGSHDQKVWTGDCVDFRIVVEGVQHQFLVGANGAMADLRNRDLAWNPTWQARAAIGETGFVVEMAIPLKEIGLVPQAGTRFVMDFGRQDAAIGNEVIVSLAPPYGNMDRAPIFVIGPSQDRQQLVGATRDFRVGDVELFVDRVTYPDFEPVATGRLCMQSQPQNRLTDKLIIAMALKSGERVVHEQRIEDVQSPTLDFDLPIQDLPPGRYTLQFRFLDGKTQFAQVQREFAVEARKAKTTGEIAITVPAAPAEVAAYPLTFGVPFPAGALFSDQQVRLVNADGVEVSIQTEVTARWSKRGSIRWILVDAILPMRREAQQYRVIFGGPARAQPSEPVRVEHIKLENGKPALRVDTGRLRFEIPTTHTPGISRLWENGRLAAEAQEGDGPYLVDEAGTVCLGSRDPEPEVVIESSGPLKAAVRVTGWHVSDQGRRGKFVLRYVAHAGLPFVQVNHSFIITDDAKVRYRDIGYAFPAKSSAGVLGTPRVTPFRLEGDKAHAYLLQRDDRVAEVVVNGRFVDECGQSEGWASNNFTTLSVRDFWQKYPKEIQVTPRQMIAHAWPAHNGAPRHGSERVSLHNLHRFWFCHEGALLDFKAPDWFVKLAASEDEPYAQSLAKTSPMGLAKTHDLLLQFHALNWEQARARTMHQVFAWNPAAICDPQWVCDSGVMGPIRHRDPQRFPALETTMDGMVQSILRQQEQDFDLGMFNFGDAHHEWNRVERRWDVHRLWRGVHHHWPRWPWTQFARSGDKTILDYARRNARHVADLSHCHYADEQAKATPYPAGKIVGGICDYKGIVHWAAGNRLDYNCVGDATLNHYYFTGDHRSLTTALEHGAALAADGRAQSSREGSGRVISALALYQHTWDNGLLPLIERTIDRFEKSQKPDGSFADDVTTWTPHFQRYTDFTGNPRGLEILQRYGNWILSDPEKHLRSMYLFGLLNNLAWLHAHTGEDRYLAAAAWHVDAMTDATYAGDDVRFRGAPTWTRNMYWSWFLVDGPAYAAVAAKRQQPAQPLVIRSNQGVRVVTYEKIDGKLWWTFQARLRQAGDTAFTIDLNLRGKELTLDLLPIGRPAVSVAATPGEQGAQRLTARVEPDGVLDYAVRIRAQEDFILPLPLLGADTQMKEAYPLARAHVAGGVRYWMDLPSSAKRFTAHYQGDDGVSKVEIFNSEDTCVYRDVFFAPNGLGRFDLPISGKVSAWSFRVMGNDGDGHGALLYPTTEPDRQIPLWFAVSPERFFWPSEAEVWR